MGQTLYQEPIEELSHGVNDPAIGRFISEDPIGFSAGDPNIFRYVGNNPVNFVDPWGLAWFRPEDDEYVAGRYSWQGFEPGTGIMAFLEDYLPAMHDTALFHDDVVDRLTGLGFPDLIANFPTMVPSYYIAAFSNIFGPGFSENASCP